MSRSLVIIIDSIQSNRQILTLMVRAATPVDVEAYPTYREALPRIRAQQPALVVCPWLEGGERMIAERIDNPDGTPTERPQLLVLANEVTPERIAVCRRAGDSHLIPSAPLNLNALRNRVLLYLEGPTTLARRLSRSGEAMRSALETLPALRKRLAL